MFHQSRHYTLNVHEHDINGTGCDGKLLMEKITHDGGTLAHENLIGCAADPTYHNPSGSHIGSEPKQFGILACCDHEL
jgi:hypothetical protein